MQFAFSSQDGSIFEGTLAFDAHGYANIDFLDMSRMQVPLHLSFRLKQQAMVYNQFLDDAWGPERPNAVALTSERSAQLRVEFFGGTATVLVDGVRLGVFELPEPLDGTSEAVHWVSVNGGVTSFAIKGEAHEARQGRGVLYAERPFLLEGWGFDPASERQDLQVMLAGTDQALPVVVLPEPDRAEEQRAPTDKIGVIALVPGWIWRYVDREHEVATFQLLANGRPCGAPLTVALADILDTIEQVCRSDTGQTSLDMLTALEHARFADLSASLSTKARATLSDAARRYKVTSFYTPPLVQEQDFTIRLPQDTQASEPLPRASAATVTSAGAEERPGAAINTLSPAPGTPEPGAFEAAQHALIERMSGVDPDDMEQILRNADLSTLTLVEQRDFLRLCAAGFCHADRFDDLYAVAEERGFADMPLAAPDWSLMYGLPFHYMDGQSEKLVATLRQLRQVNDYVEAGCLSWTLQRVLRERPDFLAEDQREEMLLAFFAHARTLEKDYFSTLHSEKLVDVGVAAVQALGTLSEPTQDAVMGHVLDLFQYSPNFWESVELLVATGEIASLPFALSRAQRAFAAFRAAIESGVPEEAFALVGERGVDTLRLRRELAASAQAGGASTGEVFAMAAQSRSALKADDDALLRHQAFPSDDPCLPEFAHDTDAAIRRASKGIPISPYAHQQRQAARAARALLEQPVETASERNALLDRFMSACALLASWRSEYLGHALPVSLLAGALTNRDSALVAEIPARIERLLAPLKVGELDQLCASAALRNALWSLRNVRGAQQSEAAHAVFDVFAPAMPHLAPPLERSADSLVPKTGLAAFHGMLVVVYSCRPNLETRVSTMRDNWLRDADAMGLPYIVVVGDGDGRREGDVVYLDAPDDYVSLPRKSIAMAQWVVEHTGFSHLYKIDDDCYLDVDQALTSLSYAKYPYYGRRLRRVLGGTDRLWHHPRGAIGNQALEIDKSPEPSEYADGSTGYVLNRGAMQQLVDAANSRHGAWLRLCSFMEDKLVGDLLALGGTSVSARDYHSIILRRHWSDARSVSVWENGFMPSQTTPAQIAHLDNAALLNEAARVREGEQLLPKRLWPSFKTLDLGWENLQLECISPPDKLRRINSADVCVVACVRNERKMLEMFLEHYRKLGVTGFLIADNRSTDGTLEYLAEEPDVAVFSAPTDYGSSRYGVAWQHTLVSQLRMNRWSIVADADEFLVLPDGVKTLPELLATPDFDGADCARIFMLDLYPEGKLEDATLETGDPFVELNHCDRAPFRFAWSSGVYNNAETWTSGLRHRLLAGSHFALFVAQKYALMRYRPWMRFSDGLHYAAEVQVAPRDLIFAHFKYHADFYERAQIETARGQHFNNAEEYRKYLALKDEGRNVIFDPEISVPWRTCEWVRRVLQAPHPAADSRAAE
ncbi:MAG: glycosyltransferase family 2 protein [Pseudomonadota bacterium]